MAECTHLDQITVEKPEEFAGCEDCLKIGATWVHLRVCRSCGHVGCCDSSSAAVDGHEPGSSEL